MSFSAIGQDKFNNDNLLIIWTDLSNIGSIDQ